MIFCSEIVYWLLIQFKIIASWTLKNEQKDMHWQILVSLHGYFNTSSAGCLETCPSTGRRPIVCLWPVNDILVLHFKCQPLSARSYVFSIKYEHFVQVSSNQKHIFIMFADVWCGQGSISKQPWYILLAVMVVLPAVMHCFAECGNKIGLL